MGVRETSPASNCLSDGARAQGPGTNREYPADARKILEDQLDPGCQVGCVLAAAGTGRCKMNGIARNVGPFVHTGGVGATIRRSSVAAIPCAGPAEERSSNAPPRGGAGRLVYRPLPVTDEKKPAPTENRRRPSLFDDSIHLGRGFRSSTQGRLTERGAGRKLRDGRSILFSRSHSPRASCMAAPNDIIDLMTRFQEHYDSYRSPSYNETQVRREFVDPFFKALGWDVDNVQG